MKSELVKRLKELEVIYKEPVRLKNVEASDFYVDIKKAFGNPNILKLMCRLLWSKMDKKTTCIAASGYGGLPLAVKLCSMKGFELAMVRNTPKNHGRKEFIDGYVPTEKDKVSVVDDVYTTGQSLREIEDIIKKTGAEILGYHVIVKRGLQEPKFLLHNVLTVEDLL